MVGLLLSYPRLSTASLLVCFILFFSFNYTLLEAEGSVYTNPINVTTLEAYSHTHPHALADGTKSISVGLVKSSPH